MIVGFLKNGNYKVHLYMNNLWKRHSISNPTGYPLTRYPTHFQQHQKASYSRFPDKKVRDIEFSVPFASSETKNVSRFSSLLNGGLVGWYLGMLKTRPILTKSITCAFINITADLSSQTMTRSTSEPYDIIRTLRMAGYGLIVLGPSLHFWFGLMSRLAPKQDLVAICKKVLLGKIIYAPIITTVFFSLNAGLQGESGSEIVARLKRDLIPTLINGVMYWTVCDFITFRFIHVHLQPLTSNAFSYLWTIYITYMASLEKVAIK